MDDKTPQSETEKDILALGQTIRALRKNIKDFEDSGEAFALSHGFARAQWNRYENGQDIRFTTLLRIIEAFEIEPAEFWDRWRKHRSILDKKP